MFCLDLFLRRPCLCPLQNVMFFSELVLFKFIHHHNHNYHILCYKYFFLLLFILEKNLSLSNGNHVITYADFFRMNQSTL